MVVLCESVGFVAHVLEQSQCEGIAAQADGFFLAGEEDFFVLFGQGDQDRGSQIAVAKGGQSGIELAFSAIDHEQIGEGFFLVGHPTESSCDDFVDRAVIVDAFDSLDFVAAVSGFEG